MSAFSVWAISQTGPNQILKKIKGKRENLVEDILEFVWLKKIEPCSLVNHISECVFKKLLCNGSND